MYILYAPLNYLHAVVEHHEYLRNGHINLHLFINIIAVTLSYAINQSDYALNTYERDG